MNKALFLDRDGTIVWERWDLNPPDKGTDKNNERYGYLTEVDQVKLIEGSADAIASAHKAGYKLIIITNQSAIARGWLSEQKLNQINQKIIELLKKENKDAVIDDIFYSPYHTDGIIKEFTKESPDRKPGIGMILKAKEKYNIDLTRSYFIGDSLSDMQCGKNAGLKNILVMTGYGRKADNECIRAGIKPEYIAVNLSEAVKFILTNDKS